MTRLFAFHPGGGLLASAGYDGTIKVWELGDRLSSRPVASFLAHKQERQAQGVAELQFAGGGERVFSSGYDDLVVEWDWRQGRKLREWHFPTPGLDRPIIALTSDGRTMYVTVGPECRRVSLDTGRVEATFGPPASSAADVSIYSMLLLEPEGVLVLGYKGATYRYSNIGYCELWDVRTGGQLRRLDGHNAGVRSIAVSPRRDLLATSSADGTAIIWDWRSGEMRHRLDVRPGMAHSNDVPTVRFSPDPDANLLLTASHDNRVVFWSTTSGRNLAEVRVDDGRMLRYGHNGALKRAEFTPNGRAVIIGVQGDIWRLDLHYYDRALRDAARESRAAGRE
jgi:WD40 repeat protein